MSYSTNIPNNGSFLGTVQKQLLANYQQIYRSFAQDHIQLDADNKGKHRSLTLRVQAADPATTATQSAIYNKLQGPTNYELFFRSNNSPTAIQLTSLNGVLETGDDQYSYMAGPFSIYIGVKRNVSNGTIVTVLPVSTLVYVGLSTSLLGNVTPGKATTAVATAMAANTFTITYNTTAGSITTAPNVYYMAIGI